MISYFGYSNYQARKQLKKEKSELSEKIEQLQQAIEKNNQIIADNEQSKRELENQSISRQEQIMNNSKIMIVLISLCLCLSLVAYTTERKIYVNQPIPANLLSDCLPNLPPQSMTFGYSLRYNEHLLNVIEKCNADKRAIREISNVHLTDD